jgi:hypothetical protein
MSSAAAKENTPPFAGTAARKSSDAVAAAAAGKPSAALSEVARRNLAKTGINVGGGDALTPASSPAPRTRTEADVEDDDGDEDDGDGDGDNNAIGGFMDEYDEDDDSASPNAYAREALRSVSKAVVDEASALAGSSHSGGEGIAALLASAHKTETVKKFKAWCLAHNPGMDLDVCCVVAVSWRRVVVGVWVGLLLLFAWLSWFFVGQCK